MNNLIRYLSIFTIGIYAQINSSASRAMDYGLDIAEYDPTNRPTVVQQIIDRDFDYLSSRPTSMWGVNGQEHYYIFNIDEKLLLKAIILDSPDQNIFNVLDMGGGLFQWGHALSNFLDNDKELATRDFKVNIINTGGEQYRGQKIEYNTKCTVYNFGAFKLENLKESLNKEGIFTEDETFDFIISSWCLRHLTDPMGTMVQAYDLLGPKRLMLFDGFAHYLALPDEEHPLEGITVHDGNFFMIKSFLDMDIPFLMGKYDHMRSFNQFMVQKSEKNIQRLPYGFDGIHDTGVDTSNCARYYLKFNGLKSQNNKNEIEGKYESFYRSFDYKSVNLLGIKSVFDYINKFDIYGRYPIKFFDGF